MGSKVNNKKGAVIPLRSFGTFFNNKKGAVIAPKAPFGIFFNNKKGAVTRKSRSVPFLFNNKKGAVTRKSRSVPFLFNNKKGDVEWDELIKMILAGVLLIVLIGIVAYYISGELTNQGDKLGDAMSFF